MVDQTGYREPYDFVENPPGQWGTKESMRGLLGTIRVHGGPLEGPRWTIQDHKRPKGTIQDHWMSYGILKGSWLRGISK